MSYPGCGSLVLLAFTTLASSLLRYLGVCQDKTGTESGSLVPEVVRKCEMGIVAGIAIAIAAVTFMITATKR